MLAHRRRILKIFEAGWGGVSGRGVAGGEYREWEGGADLGARGGLGALGKDTHELGPAVRN